MKESKWRQHLPALLILGSPAVAAGMTLCALFTSIFLLSEHGLVTLGITLLVAINGLLAMLGAAVGALRVGGTVPTRIAVLLASTVSAAAMYYLSLVAANEFIPGFAEGFEKFGP